MASISSGYIHYYWSEGCLRAGRASLLPVAARSPARVGGRFPQPRVAQPLALTACAAAAPAPLAGLRARTHPVTPRKSIGYCQ